MKINCTVLVLFMSVLFSQVSLSDVREMSNEQLDLIRQELNNNTLIDKYNDICLKITSENIDLMIIVGALIVIGSGLFTTWREYKIKHNI